jgi:hypothetical protein
MHYTTKIHPCCQYTHQSFTKCFTLYKSGMMKVINPSIAKYGKGFLLSCRYTNATTINLLVRCTFSLYNRSQLLFLITDENFNITRRVHAATNNRVLQDPRVIELGEKYLVSITETKPGKTRPIMMMYSHNLTLLYERKYNGYYPDGPVEKNWCPFVYKSKVYIHTDTFPLWRVYNLDVLTGNLSCPVTFNTSKLFNEYKIVRCSTSWIPFTSTTFLCGLHTRYNCMPFSTYRTILVEIDALTMLPIRISSELCIDSDHNYIQFLSGMARRGDTIYMSFGLADCESRVVKVPLWRIRNMFNSESSSKSY